MPRVDQLTARAEAAQRVQHARLAGQGCAAVVGSELTLAREPGHHDHAESAKHELEHHHQQEAGRRALVVARAAAGQRIGDDAGEEHHERVDDALQQRHRDHVAVGDVRHLVGQHALHLVAPHRAQEAGRHRHQAAALARAGRERVDLGRIVDSHLGHRQVGLPGELLDRAVEPVGRGVTRAPVHEPHARHSLGRPARDLQRDEGPAHAPQEAEGCEAAQVEPVGSDVAAHTEHVQDDRKREDDRDVGDEEEDDPFGHSGFRIANQPGPHPNERARWLVSLVSYERRLPAVSPSLAAPLPDGAGTGRHLSQRQRFARIRGRSAWSRPPG